MKKHLLTWTILLSIYGLKAQSQDSLVVIADQIVSEATLLYKSEKASWYGTDVFVEKYKDKVSNSGGYFSYSDKGIDKCIFYSKEDMPKVVATIEFNGVYSVAAAKSNGEERAFTDLEKDLYTIRTLALKQINSDTLFKTYKNTNLNLIPIITDKQRKVYVLTGPQNGGVVIIGNDYELTFDKNNALINTRKIHNSMISLEYSGEKGVVGAAHTHLATTGDFMTVTDICTLMLYQKSTKWQQHFVMSANYVSIWDCEKNTLLILTTAMFDSINGDGGKKSKKKKKN
jgi:hypothetical protein